MDARATRTQIADYIERGLEFVKRGEMFEARHEFFTRTFPSSGCVLGIALVGKEGSVERAMIAVLKAQASKASDFAQLIGCDPKLARWMSRTHLMHSADHPRKSAEEIMFLLRSDSPDPDPSL